MMPTHNDSVNTGPLSYAQERLWFLDRMNGGIPEYNIRDAWRMTGELDPAALKSALASLISRHDILRTRFSEVNGIPTQIVDPLYTLSIAEMDLSQLSDSERRKQIAQILRNEARAPFDVLNGPPIRCALLKLSPREHILINTLHHIISDAWSQRIFRTELIALYDGLRRDRVRHLPAVEATYLEHAAEQRSSAQLADTANGLGYWKHQLAGVAQVLSLRTDRERRDQRDVNARHCRRRLSSERMKRVNDACRSYNVTPFMLLMGVCAAVISRHSDEADVVIGTAVANRDDWKTENTLGLFVNSLPLRFSIRPGVSVSEFMGQVRTIVCEALKHQDVPFEQVVEVVSPQRRLSVSPLFQISVTMHESAWETIHAGELEIRPLRYDLSTARLDLEIHLERRGADLEITWLYSDTLFEPWRIRKLSRHYMTLLDTFLRDPECEVSRIPLLTASELARIQNEWNATTVPGVYETTIPNLFEAQVASSPDAVAVEHNGQHVTYRELNERANELAHDLIRRGIGPESVVAVEARIGIEATVAVMGILKSGAAYLPIDPDLPSHRIGLMIEKAEARCIVVAVEPDSEMQRGIDQIVLDRYGLAQPLENRHCGNPSDADRIVPLRADHPLYVIFTSGSTGVPKGVTGLHASMVNRISWFRSVAPLAKGDRVLVASSMAFIDTSTGLLGTLCDGGTLVCAEPKVDAATLVRFMREQRISRTTLVPSLLSMMVNEADSGELGCTLLISSGEPLTTALVSKCRLRFPEARVMNLYGSTECGGDSLYAEASRVSSLIGKPIWNTTAYVLDSHLELQPVGVRGELYIGGVGLARGYCGSPALTAERFVASPYGEEGSRIYRTGDLACWGRNGELEFIGRIDHQVKINGVRIELSEIEAALRASATVAHAVVMVSEDAHDRRLIAFVAPLEGSTVVANSLRQEIARVLPYYMVPWRIIIVEQIPLTQSGKADRRALADSLTEVCGGRTEYVAPRNDIEQCIASVWAEVLCIARVGADDNFFALGGHSLLAMRINARIASAVGCVIPLRAIFQWPTLGEFAAEVIRLSNLN
jgi:amino acid adenylation domain-containing protein